jgi:Peptidase family M28
MRWLLAVAMSLVFVVGCSGDDTDDAPTGTGDGPEESPSATSPSASGPTEPSPTATSPAAPVRFERAAAMRTVRQLAGRIGPREAASPAFRRAAAWVERRLTDLGYDVRRQTVRVPEGVSWGVPVEAGRTSNVLAATADLRPGRPYVIVGAHLDTVPQAPGAEDNASGISVLLELARMAAAEPTRYPVLFVAFGGEEPRGDGDDDHHFGSRAFVARMTGPERQQLRGMVSLDRVGVGRVVPVCSGGLEPPTVRRALLRTARRIDVPAEPCENQASDHWSFDKAGLPAARIGSTPYAEYHSSADRPGVVNPAQLDRVGRLMWAWLR